MKISLVLSLLLLSLNLQAYDNTTNGNMNTNMNGGGQRQTAKFQEIKTKIQERQQQHLKMLQENIECVNNAMSMDDLRACRAKAKEQFNILKSEFPKGKNWNPNNQTNSRGMNPGN